jgi:phage-related protein
MNVRNILSWAQRQEHELKLNLIHKCKQEHEQKLLMKFHSYMENMRHGHDMNNARFQSYISN